MRDLALLEQYLIRLRQEMLQQGHAHALKTAPDLTQIVICAHEAELVERIRGALKELEKDPGQFLKAYLT